MRVSMSPMSVDLTHISFEFNDAYRLRNVFYNCGNPSLGILHGVRKNILWVKKAKINLRTKKIKTLGISKNAC
jgi:hypothetical protein